MITPARLAELIGFLQDRTDGGFGASGDVGNDTIAALRELESARTQLEGVARGLEGLRRMVADENVGSTAVLMEIDRWQWELSAAPPQGDTKP